MFVCTAHCYIPSAQHGAWHRGALSLCRVTGGVPPSVSCLACSGVRPFLRLQTCTPLHNPSEERTFEVHFFPVHLAFTASCPRASSEQCFKRFLSNILYTWCIFQTASSGASKGAPYNTRGAVLLSPGDEGAWAGRSPSRADAQNRAAF